MSLYLFFLHSQVDKLMEEMISSLALCAASLIIWFGQGKICESDLEELVYPFLSEGSGVEETSHPTLFQ